MRPQRHICRCSGLVAVSGDAEVALRACERGYDAGLSSGGVVVPVLQ